MYNTKQMLAVVHKRFGKTAEEACKQFGYNDSLATELIKGYPWGIHENRLNDGSWQVCVGFKGYVTLLTFHLQPYPSCCGSSMFHTFMVDESKVSQEALDEIMNAFFTENHDNVAAGQNNRLEVVMVERRRNKQGTPVYGRDPLAEPEPHGENPNMMYKSLWNFFHKYAKRVRTRYEVNYNTANVLHNMEVIL